MKWSGEGKSATMSKQRKKRREIGISERMNLCAGVGIGEGSKETWKRMGTKDILISL